MSAAIKNESLSIEHIQIPLCTVIQRENHYKWIQKSTVPLFTPIPSESDLWLVTAHKHFCYPEFSKDRQHLEPRTFDFTRIPTSVRFWHVVSISVQSITWKNSVKTGQIWALHQFFFKIDTQNAFKAMRMFNYNVECWMKDKGYLKTANFIKLVHNWHNACNWRGLTADTCVHYMNELHVFLTHKINFNCVPFKFPDR